MSFWAYENGWSFSKFGMWAVAYPVRVDGTSDVFFLDVTDFRATFSVDGIPSATIGVAVGRSADGPDEISDLFSILSVATPIHVWFHGREWASYFGLPTSWWPEHPFVLFQGVITSISFDTTVGAAYARVSMTHWLNDLNLSSSLSALTHVGSPSNFFSPASLIGGTGFQTAFVPSAVGADFLAPVVQAVDIWAGNRPGTGIFAFLAWLASHDLLQIPSLQHFAGYRNDTALAALLRFEPFADAWFYGFPNYWFGVQLSLAVDDPVIFQHVANAIADELSSDTIDSLSGQTLWTKLIHGYCRSLMLSVVPTVDRALLVPLTCGSHYWWLTISPSEYTSINLSNNYSEPVAAVALLGQGASWSGAFAAGSAPQHLDIVGYFANPLMWAGQTVFRPAPSWLAKGVLASVYSVNTIAPHSVASTIYYPGMGLPPVLPFDAQEFTALGSRVVADQFARYAYVSQALSGRVGSIRGRFRLDVAPGSTVCILTYQDPALALARGVFPEDAVIAEVASVTLVLDAREPRAETQLTLNNVRTLSENFFPATSLPRHPLWRYPWCGAPLVAHPAFIPDRRIQFLPD